MPNTKGETGMISGNARLFIVESQGLPTIRVEADYATGHFYFYEDEDGYGGSGQVRLVIEIADMSEILDRIQQDL